jgi:outer membrane receptor protein involved in Fe transport
MKRAYSARRFLLLTATLPALGALAQPEPKPVSDEVLALPEFSVSTASDDSFVATESTSGTRVVADVINLPFSISVLTEDFVKEFQLFDLDQQAPFISGMAAGDPAQGGGGGTRLRGFSVPYFRNGFARSQAPDSNSIARTEVIKGPQSAIYGRVSPGGVVNYISKKPGTKYAAGLSAVTGSYDYQRITGDITGPIIPGKLFYRVDAAYYDFERPTDFWYNRTINLSGSVAYKLSPNTQLTLEHEYTDRLMQGGQAFTRWTRVSGTQTITEGSVFYMPDRAVGDRLARFAVNGAHNFVKRTANSSYLTLEHRISPDLSLRANLSYTTREFLKDGTSTPATWAVNPTAARQAVLNTLVGTWVNTSRGIWTGDRAGAYQTIDYEEKGMQIDLTKKWNTRMKQRTLITFDTYYNEQATNTYALSGTALNSALNALGYTTTAQLNAWKNPDPFNPSVSGYYVNPAFNPATWSLAASKFDRFYYGSLLNHTVELMDGRLYLTGSARHDWAEYTVNTTEGAAKKFTHSTGANYRVLDRRLVGYVNVASGFNPSPQFDANTGALLGNLESFGGEAGLKGALMEDRFSYTLAAFNVEQENEVTDNPENPGGTDLALPRSIPGASTRSRGMSIDVGGKVSSNLTLLANMAWTEVRIVKHASTPSLVGTRPTGTQAMPPRTYSLAARYNFRDGLLRGLRLGLTYQFAKEHLRIAPTTNATGTAISVPYFNRTVDEWGLVLGYAPKRLSNGARLDLSVNVNNLFDEKEMTVAAYYPEGRTVRFTAGLRF